jgi:hypothetical protein
VVGDAADGGGELDGRHGRAFLCRGRPDLSGLAH